MVGVGKYGYVLIVVFCIVQMSVAKRIPKKINKDAPLRRSDAGEEPAADTEAPPAAAASETDEAPPPAAARDDETTPNPEATTDEAGAEPRAPQEPGSEGGNPSVQSIDNTLTDWKDNINNFFKQDINTQELLAQISSQIQSFANKIEGTGNTLVTDLQKKNTNILAKMENIEN